jgi:hypothetical protein
MHHVGARGRIGSHQPLSISKDLLLLNDPLSGLIVGLTVGLLAESRIVEII